MQESRLFKIVYYLLEKGQATAPELAKAFEVSVRTIYRDIDALSAAGIPVYTEAGRTGGIHLMKHFVLNKAILSEEEKQEILTALQSVNTAGKFSSKTLQKLSGIFQLNSDEWLEVDFSRWGSKETDNSKFDLLKSAVIHRQCIRIKYAGSNGDITERVVQPLKLSYKSMAWYLKAYCTEKQAVRIFKLNRILSLEMLPEHFVRRSFEQTDVHTEQICHKIVLCFPRNMAYRVYDEFDNTQVKQTENGDLIVSVEMPEDEWLIGFLLSFGTQMHIIEPTYLKEILADQAEKIYKKYKS
ncbi:MAG: YafY family transcriptional regulator [Eubacterium sp.]